MDSSSVSWKYVGVVVGFVCVVVAGAIWFMTWVGGDDSSGDGGASRPSRSHASPSPAPAPAPTPPPLPPDATQNNETGAQAFARYTFGIENYLQATDDLTPSKQQFRSDECSQCEAVIKNHEARINRGEHIRGGEYLVKVVQARKETDDLYIAAVTYDRDMAYLVNDKGHQIGESVAPKTNLQGYLGLRYEGGRWRILTLSPAS